jgi:hypothetical protein
MDADTEKQDAGFFICVHLRDLRATGLCLFALAFLMDRAENCIVSGHSKPATKGRMKTRIFTVNRPH